MDSYQYEPKKRTLVLQRVNAGSHKFYSINPTALSFTGWLELKAGLVSVAVYGNVDTFGKNYAKGFTLGLSTRLVFSMESDSSNYKDYKHLNEPPEEGEESEEYFSEQDDDSEESDSSSGEEDSEGEDLFPEEDDPVGEDLFPEEGDDPLPEEESDEMQNEGGDSDLPSDKEKKRNYTTAQKK